jgi:hypothetical protein
MVNVMRSAARHDAAAGHPPPWFARSPDPSRAGKTGWLSW